MRGSWLRRIVLFALVWWIIVEGRLDAWPLAVVGIGAATAASLKLLPPGRAPSLAFSGLLGFLCYFVGQSLLGGFQVARLALQVRPLLRPALIELPLTLPPGLPRLLFTATLGLMPGTLGVRLDKDSLLIHVLDAELPIAEKADVLAGHISHLFGVNR
jgi:multicomponent Na+:H+ antiporter subunit E